MSGRKTLIHVLLLAPLLLSVMTPPALADLCWENEQVTQGVRGQPDGKRTVKTCISSQASRTEVGDKVMIMDFDTMTLYTLDRKNKTYTKTDFNKMGMPGAKPGSSPEDTKSFQQMMAKMMDSIKITPTEETKKIDGYKCKKYIMSFMMMNTEYWVSKDVKGYDEIKKINKKVSKAFQNNPMLKNMNTLGIMEQLDGFPIKTVSSVMGGTSTSTLKSIEKTSLSKSMFQVPKDYKLVENK